jgi:hypothetical protein
VEGTFELSCRITHSSFSFVLALTLLTDRSLRLPKSGAILSLRFILTFSVL